jgi:hypothetical protein
MGYTRTEYPGWYYSQRKRSRTIIFAGREDSRAGMRRRYFSGRQYFYAIYILRAC